MTAPVLNAAGYRSGANAANTTTTTALLAPTAFSDGDCIYVPIASDAPTGQTFTGWTGSSALYTVFDIPATTPTATGALFRKPSIVKASETYNGTDYEFPITLGTTERQAWFCFSVTGDGGIGAKGTDNTGSGATATIPAITTTAADSLIVAVIFTDQVGTPFGAATGYTKLGEQSGTSAASVAVYYQTVATVQTVAAQNVTLSSEQWRVIVFEILAAGGAVSLTVANASQAQSTDNLALTQHNVLTVASASQTQAADAVTLGVGLVVANASQAQSADNVALTQHNALTVASASQAQTAGALTLMQHNVLTVANASQAQTAGALTLTSSLTIANVSQAQTADNVTIDVSTIFVGEIALTLRTRGRAATLASRGSLTVATRPRAMTVGDR